MANDVHGKNHHRCGTFGGHVNSFELLRSDGSRRICSRSENNEFFSATVGGLGLTGLITWVEINLKRVETAFLDVEVCTLNNLDDFFNLSSESNDSHEYTVAWIDCLAKGDSLGKGLFFRANHQVLNHAKKPGFKIDRKIKKKIQLPFNPPFSLVNSFTVKIFNSLYYYNQLKNLGEKTQSLDSFFYPLDSIQSWNRLYGRKGFLQYQCVVPKVEAQKNISEILKIIAASRQGSFLSVLKMFGDNKSLGMLSFPRDGVTLALDFPYKGEKTLRLLNKLDDLIILAGGAVYPAKDARMQPSLFKRSFPRWPEFSNYIDPNFSSIFCRRIMEERN